MTLFAGIYSRGGELSPPGAAREGLKRLVSRSPLDTPAVFEDERAFFVKVDVGAYGEPAWRVDEGGAVTALAGEPLLSAGGAEDWRGRASDVEALHEAWLGGDWDILRRARGVFCAAHYSPSGGLALVADKLCVRPLYYWAGEEYVVFSTALRVLEGLELVPKELDVRAVSEMVGLGVPLGTRTPYAGVALLRAGEVLRFDGRSSSARRYWSWDDIRPSARDENDLAREAYAQFTAAVARRARRDKTTFAFLSGGLDSRCVVAALAWHGLHVHTFNFSPDKSQDQIFGAGFARVAGTTHTEAPRKDEGGPDWTQMLADAWRAAPARASRPAERPSLGWSGDGGSVGLGHVYVSGEIVKLMRAGEVDSAVEAYLRQEHANVPEKFFRPDVAAALSDVLRRGVREELDAVRSADAGRGFHLFLMLNDQRRHLARHFENVDLHRLELQLPFYDSDFLGLVLSVPVEACLGHRFYTKFLACFPPEVTSVPWQTYPGHDPCPLPVPEGLGYQWNGGGRASRRRSVARQACALIGAGDFPRGIFSRGRVGLAALAHLAGVRDYGYVIEAARTYHQYWSLSGGRYQMPPAQEGRG